MTTHRCFRPLALTAASLLFLAGGAQAQVAATEAEGGGWNSPVALTLIERARERRAAPRADSGLVNYQAAAAGHVYFFLDRADSEDRVLVKADQIALEVYWAAPDRTKQRIVGLRDASKLPNQMNYHLDHLTVVQDEFGDLIRLGDGDEVRDVLHPAAPRSDQTYDFRLADSMTIRLSGSADPIQVHEIEVRPRHPDRPAFVGSLFLDQATAAIVRMSFTFTPASYVDQRLDYIQVGLDNGLWDGRYWLPNEQTLEIRRQVPILDFPTGGVIRGVFRISDYRFNQELPPGLFRGARVVAAPRSEREAHPFPAGLFDELAAEGLSATTDLAGLRRQATALLSERYLSGLPRLRLYLPNSSAALRYNRAEALFLGGGVSYATSAASRLRFTTGYATGPGHLSLTGDWRISPDRATNLWLRAEHRTLRDLGLRPGMPGLLNTVAAASLGEDFLDPYFATGAALGLERQLDQGWNARIVLGYEEHHNAALQETHAIFNQQAAFRPVRRIATGPLLHTNLTISRGRTAAPGWNGRISVEAGRFNGAGYLRPLLEATVTRRARNHDAALELRGATGFLAGTAPPQTLFLLGGAGTLPGYTYRAFAGDRFALVGLEAYSDLAAPWVRLRAVGTAGWTELGAATAPAEWAVHATDGLRTSLGAGVGLFYDLLRIDLVRGLQQGRWQWVFSASPALADIL
jgi:hypothetical protein